MEIDFEKLNGLVPAIIQDINTDKVLMLGFMNQEAYQKTVSEKKVTFFSRSKERLWTKGETSGNFLFVKDIKIDCDNDTLLIKAEPVGPACHTGQDTCFDEENTSGSLSFLSELESVIANRKESLIENSYTSKLFKSGKNVELVIAALNSETKRITEEAADLLFHYLVLLQESELKLDDVVGELRQRHR
jgi:phosphoribosyl-AMP cyclohydrolase / phosphoribosyl-ATP pyrophosphohydrolase